MPSDPSSDHTGLSYKFQRLREKLRNAIASGELSGKLPGERALAKRFHVNAKTLSKALTDLAAEGLLDRSIGRGTFVKGQSPASLAAKRWLLVCDPEMLDGELVKLLRAAHLESDVVTDVRSLRPSFLNQFSAVLDLACQTPGEFLRDLVVRNIPVVVIDKEPRTYSTHAVLFDHPLAVSQLGRELLLGGHRHLAVLEPRGSTSVVNVVRAAAHRFNADAHVDACFGDDCAAMVNGGVTALLCQSPALAAQAMRELHAAGISVPGQVSVAAVGYAPDDFVCSGVYLPREEQARTILHLLNEIQPRPTTFWLAGRYADHGTVSIAPAADSMDGVSHYHPANGGRGVRAL